jgi:DUF1680 family protein
MFQLHGDSKYIDVLEKILYNGLISGVGLDGKSFFYTNAMQVTNTVHHHNLEGERSGWFECSCCPTNVARFLPAVPGYIYAQKGKEVFVNLFISSHSKLNVAGKAVDIVQQNNYPWDGALKFTVSPKNGNLPFSLNVRIPGWARNEAIPSGLYHFQDMFAAAVSIRVNGEAVGYDMADGYAIINRTWKKNDIVEVNLPMEVRRVSAMDSLKEDLGKVALQRGPLMYCAEWADNKGSVSNLLLPSSMAFTTAFEPGLLNGVMTIKSVADKITISENKVSTVKESFTAIPYYAWANRGKGEMMLWFPEKLKSVVLLTH